MWGGAGAKYRPKHDKAHGQQHLLSRVNSNQLQKPENGGYILKK